ncbi:glycoside hydrolase family 97 protein [Alistipes finegoldii]|uniref:glycoside hydrolase family 97 protein n=1 Tax=Alistipes finegoldii TaxID=214856 RepID=UPI00242C97DA|nr:glycoside hydrolase family 97 protein [Alistipes finegoldii]
MKSFLFSLAALALCGACSQNTGVTSPDGTIRLAFAVDSAGRMTYSVTDGGVRLFEPSRLGFEAAETDLGGGFAVENVSRTSVDETWTQPWGENKENRSRYNEMAVRLRNGGGVRLTLRFRVFDDGLGFRYEYEACGADSLRVTDELTEFRFAADGDSWTIPASFDTYELLYRKLPLSELADANTPATFKVGGLYGSIHEAALYDFPEMTLRKTDGLAFKSDLAPLPDGTKAHVGNKFTTAWRTVQLAPDAVGLINSSLILNLNEPSKIGDTSWIRPMKYVGVWWGMHLGVETWAMDDRHGATTENAKRHIDFAAANNIQGVLFEGWNEGWENWGGSQSFDFTKPYADFDIAEIVRYARERGIEIIGHHETGGNIPDYERQLERAVKWYADLGIHNLKTGYAGGISGGNNHHGQYMVRHYQHVVETAAKYRMTVNAHEPIKDCGIRRTWPNMMSREGARGKEWDAWSAGNPPSHEVTLPFTRLLAGPMDFTPGTFDILYENTRNSPRRKLWNCGPEVDMRVNTTLAKQIAEWVIIYSPVQMASDLIENYEGHPAFRFFRDFDADCDWSRALAGEPGEFVAVVRRAGENYFLGAATDEQPRTLSLPLDFLKPGTKYRATIYADGPDADWKTNPTSYTISEREVSSADTLEVAMAPGGGQAVSFMPAM